MSFTIFQPLDTPFHQQRLRSYNISCSKFGYVAFFLLFGLILVPLGAYFLKLSDATYEQSIMYDGDTIDESSSCVITEGNAGSFCQVGFIRKEFFLPFLYVFDVIMHAFRYPLHLTRM